MFKPEFNYTHNIVRNLMDIEGAKTVGIAAEMQKIKELVLTHRELQELADLSHTTAHKELLTLVQSGLLNKKGKARGTYYIRVDDF